MRTAYHQRLVGLTTQLAEMCRLAGVAMQHATQALLSADLPLASSVLRDEEEIAAVGEQIRQDAFVLLALQAPVAGDLRAVIASIQNAADVERMGSLALHVAQIAARRYPHPALPDDLRRHFTEMGRIAADLSRGAQQALTSGDPQAAALVPETDDVMDRLHQQVLNLLVDGDDRYGSATAVDVTLLSKFYERFADHAVEVARRVIFQATGQLPENHSDSAGRVFATAGAAAGEASAGSSTAEHPDNLVSVGARGDRDNFDSRMDLAGSAALSD